MDNKEEKLFKMRHSLAHIMAAAVQRIYKDAKFGVGPAISDGFYYDIDLGENKISEKNFGKIEKAMRRIIAEKQDFVRSEVSIEEMEADHIQPWSKGGKTVAENCQMLCKKDNREKSDK